jgi:hypothetical protein
MRNGGITLVLHVAGGLMLCVAPSGSGTKADDSAGRKPNVLLIVSEDYSPDLSCYGNS